MKKILYIWMKADELTMLMDEISGEIKKIGRWDIRTNMSN